MKRAFALSTLLTALLVLAFYALPVSAQSDNAEYHLNLRRNFGYSSGGEIRGNFSLSISESTANVTSVSYLLDGKEMTTLSLPNFAYQFQTGDYPNGWHDLSATVKTKDGRTVTTPVRRFKFATADEEMATTRNIIIPVIGGVMLLLVVIVGAQMIFMRGKNSDVSLGAQRTYGIWGGTICSRCGRPFSMHAWGLNLGIWKLDRCDFCGKWGLMQRKSLEELRAAEKAELGQAGTSSVELNGNHKEDELKRLLEESKYTDQK